MAQVYHSGFADPGRLAASEAADDLTICLDILGSAGVASAGLVKRDRRRFIELLCLAGEW